MNERIDQMKEPQKTQNQQRSILHNSEICLKRKTIFKEKHPVVQQSNTNVITKHANNNDKKRPIFPNFPQIQIQKNPKQTHHEKRENNEILQKPNFGIHEHTKTKEIKSLINNFVIDTLSKSKEEENKKLAEKKPQNFSPKTKEKKNNSKSVFFPNNKFTKNDYN